MLLCGTVGTPAGGVCPGEGLYGWRCGMAGVCGCAEVSGRGL